MDWKRKVELFEQLRRGHEFGIGAVARVAAKFGVHRRIVRQALAGAAPPVHQHPARKQRHTARRIFRRTLTMQSWCPQLSLLRTY